MSRARAVGGDLCADARLAKRHLGQGSSPPHVDIDSVVTDGRFRNHLCYRIDVVRMTVPPVVAGAAETNQVFTRPRDSRTEQYIKGPSGCPRRKRGRRTS